MNIRVFFIISTSVFSLISFADNVNNANQNYGIEAAKESFNEIKKNPTIINQENINSLFPDGNPHIGEEISFKNTNLINQKIKQLEEKGIKNAEKTGIVDQIETNSKIQLKYNSEQNNLQKQEKELSQFEYNISTPVIKREMEEKPNDEFDKTVSELNILNNIKNSEDEFDCKLSPSFCEAIKEYRSRNFPIMPGQVLGCKFDEVGASDCCKENGWAQDIKLSKCSESEKQLMYKRKSGHCVQVGKYCSKKVAGICLVKTRSFCCFNEKLSKLVNEQGRPQIGKAFGTPKYPDCSGFTVPEFQSLNFDKFDLSEFYQELKEKINIESIKASLSRMQQKFHNNNNTNNGVMR